MASKVEEEAVVEDQTYLLLIDSNTMALERPIKNGLCIVSYLMPKRKPSNQHRPYFVVCSLCSLFGTIPIGYRPPQIAFVSRYLLHLLFPRLITLHVHHDFASAC